MGLLRFNICVLIVCVLYLLQATAASPEGDSSQAIVFFHHSRLPRSTSKLPPEAGSNGWCYTYTVQEAETCQTIATAHKVTSSEIESFNANTWGWKGCDKIQQGDFICLSAGEPPMPVALPQATCGPQVPGTARPKDYAKLASLNPCPSNYCCTVKGQCTASSVVCLSDSCISGCEAKKLDTTPIQDTTQTKTTTHLNSKTTTEAKLKTTTTTDHETISKAHTTATTTTAKTTTKAASTSSEKPVWTLAAYTGQNCDGDYYVLEGHRADDSKCVDIHGGLSTSDSGSGVSCVYFTDGGFSSNNCASSPNLKIWSWILSGATCSAYAGKGCKGDIVELETYSSGCQAETWRRPHYYTTWLSIKCTAK